MQRIACLIVVSVLIVISVSASAKTGLDASWDKGLRFNSEDGSFKLRVGGRTMIDWAWFNQSTTNQEVYGNWQDGTEFRRIRLYMEGTVYYNVLYKAQYEFGAAARTLDIEDADDVTPKEVVVKDMFIGMKDIPALKTILVGHQKEPYSLEQMTSSKYITFMERSPASSFDAERNTGIVQHGGYADNRLTTAVGWYRITDDGGRRSLDGEYAGTARVTGVAWRNADKGGVLHLGLAGSWRNTDNFEFKTRPSSHLAKTMVSTGKIGTKSVGVFGAEGAWVYGPFSLQSEYKMVALDAPESQDPSFSGFYVFGTYFITGEKRAYKASRGVFDRNKPKKNFRDEGGLGAWQLALRYTYVDLNDKMIYGGELHDAVLGLNWYLNPNTRVMFNYVYAKANNLGEGKIDGGYVNIFETRFQIDF